MKFAQGIGPYRADVTQRGKVGDLAGPVRGIHRQGGEHLELRAEAGMLGPLTGQFGPFPRAQMADRPGGDELFTGIVPHLDHGEPVVFGGENRAGDLDSPAEGGFALE